MSITPLEATVVLVGMLMGIGLVVLVVGGVVHTFRIGRRLRRLERKLDSNPEAGSHTSDGGQAQ